LGWLRGWGVGRSEYKGKFERSEKVDVKPTRIYRLSDAREFLTSEGIDADSIASQVDGKLMSAFVRAVKPSQQ
jgi:hypothetical protein